MGRIRERTPWKKFRHWMEYVVCLILNALVPLLPRRVVAGLAEVFGSLAYFGAGEPRRIALANLDIAFGETKSAAEKRRIARRSFVNFTLVGLDMFWSRRLCAGNWRRYIQADEGTLALGRAVYASGQGAIGMTLHLGNWEWLGLVSAYQNFPLTVIADELRNPLLDTLFRDLRRDSGYELIYQKGAAPKVLRALRAGRTVAAVVDLNTRLEEGGVWMKFFGVPVLATPAVAALALRTRVPIMLGVCIPVGRGLYQLRYGPELKFKPSGDAAVDRIALTQAMLDMCESVIRENPECWLWTYERWKWRPSKDRAGFPFYSKVVTKHAQQQKD